MPETIGKPTFSDDGDAEVIAPTLDAVLANCHISDARHAGDYTLCVYLLKMREFFRWEKNLPYHHELDREELSEWVTRREAYWESVVEDELHDIPVQGKDYDAFDQAGINEALNPMGYVYSSGYGRGMKPVFFLGKLREQRNHREYRLLTAGRELARELAAPPAMSRERTIFVRRESLRRMIWEKVEEWQWNQPQNAMKDTLGCYDFDNDPETSLDKMTDNEVRTVMLHEAGEVEAGALLGDAWEELLGALPHSKAELMMRAVRDNLADALVTLPALLPDNNPATIHFYMATMSNLRKQMQPALVEAYGCWRETGDNTAMLRHVSEGRTHWLSLAREILEAAARDTANCSDRIASLVETRTL